MAARGPAEPQVRPEIGDILLVIHDFAARSSDELSLSKGDRVELIERDDEFGDGWFFGKHMVNGSHGLFPEVYTRPSPKGITSITASQPAKPAQAPTADVVTSPTAATATTTKPALAVAPTQQDPAPPYSALSTETTPTTTSVAPTKPDTASTATTSPSVSKSAPPSSLANSTRRLNSSQDSQVLHDTLTVINEHITDLRSTPSNGALRTTATDSGSEYSSQMDPRLSYIQGEETDEEEDSGPNGHTLAEVEAWTPDDVAEYLFTVGVEKHHCEVFRDQEISGEVLMGMDHNSLFINAFALGSVGRRLKTWHKIQALQEEVNGGGRGGRRTTQTYGSEIGSDGARSTRSRNNTLTNSMQKQAPMDDRRSSNQSKRLSLVQTPRLEPTQTLTMSPVSPIQDSPSRPYAEKRPSAASVRDLHHSRRHSSNDFRLTGTTLNTSAVTPKLNNAGTFPISEVDTTHKKQPSFDRNWTMGGASNYSQRPLSSTGFQDMMAASDPDLLEQPLADDRGYFSGPDAETRRRNVLRKRDSLPHSRKSSYAEEQPQQPQQQRGEGGALRSPTTAISAAAAARHSRYGSMDSVQVPRDNAPSPAAQKYYNLPPSAHRRTASTNTTDSVRHMPKSRDAPSPTVTKLDGPGPTKAMAPMAPMAPLMTADNSSVMGNGVRGSPISPTNRHAVHGEWLNLAKPVLKTGGLGGMRAASDNHDRNKLASPVDSAMSRDSPVQSPARTGSSTPSAGPSFELDSPGNAKSPNSTVATAASRGSGGPGAAPARKPGAVAKTKKETSAYQRGLQKISPREAMKEADYSGWMKKKSSHLMTTWKPRLFVLKGRRLAYYYSDEDAEEKGLIDISFHRVLPADNERLTGLHATITGATGRPTAPAGSHVQTLADADSERQASLGLGGPDDVDSMFIFKLVPPRAGLSRAVNFTKPTVHYFSVPNVKQGRLWMAALMKATIDRDDTQVVTTTYQQKTISLAKARQMRHRPPALMNLDEDNADGNNGNAAGQPARPLDDEKAMLYQQQSQQQQQQGGGGGGVSGMRAVTVTGMADGNGNARRINANAVNSNSGLGIVVFREEDSGVAGLDKLGLHKVESAKANRYHLPFDDKDSILAPQSA